MRVLLVPDTAYDRGVARRLWSRLDQIEGYPRTHSADEPGVAAAPGRPLPRTETLWAGYEREDGVIALPTGGVPERLRSRRISYGGTTRTVEEWIGRLVAERGWQFVETLPGEPEEWQPLAVRDGADGSPDGVPIPEGDE